MKELRGGCLCGAVEYSVPDDLSYAGYCHCTECRRFSGSAFSAFGGVQSERFVLISGSGHLGRYHKSEDTTLVFCKTCGSSLYSEKPKRGMMHLRLGSLRDAPSRSPQVHVHVGSKASWYEIRDELTQFRAAPERRL